MKISPVKIIADAMLEKKAQDVLSLDLRGIGTAICDHFVICNADSTTAVNAIADNVLVKMEEKAGLKVLRMQGLENGFWIILDSLQSTASSIAWRIFGQTPNCAASRMSPRWPLPQQKKPKTGLSPRLHQNCAPLQGRNKQNRRNKCPHSIQTR